MGFTALYHHIKTKHHARHMGTSVLAMMGILVFVAQVFTVFAPQTYAQQQQDLSITTIVENGIVTPGSLIGFQYLYSNNTSPHTGASNVVITVTLSAGLVPDSSFPAWTSQSGNNYYYNVADGTADLFIQFVATTSGSSNGVRYSAVSVQGGQADTNMENNSSTGYVLVIDDVNQEVDLSITSSFTGSLTPGGDVTYVLHYENKSNKNAYGVDVFGHFSQGLQSITTSSSPTSISGSLYRWHIGDLPAATTGSISIDSVISPLVESGYTLTVQGEIDGILDDTNTNNNSVTLENTVIENALLPGLSILGSTGTLCVGSNYNMTILRQNISETIVDPYIDIIIPAQMIFQNGGGSPTLVQTGTYRWYVDAGDIGVLEFAIRANQAAQNISIQTYIADEENTVYVESDALFDIVSCVGGSGVGDPEEQTDETGPAVGVVYHGTTTDSEDTNNPITEAERIKAITCIQGAQEIYTYARDSGITTMRTIHDARLCDPVMRIELAKMLALYAQNHLNMQLDTDRVCIFDDLDKVPVADRIYATQACQLGLMGLQYDGTENTVFNPYDRVTRDIFVTAFSRALFKDTYNGNTNCWYCSHMNALYKAGIVKYLDPSIIELRGYIMTVMYRTTDFIAKITNK